MRAIKTLLALCALLLVGGTAGAAQIVVLDVHGDDAESAKLSAALSTQLAQEVGRYQGVTVISQFEVTALLEHEVNKQALGCDDVSCMTEIARAMAAELLLLARLSRVAGEWQLAAAAAGDRAAFQALWMKGYEKNGSRTFDELAKQAKRRSVVYLRCWRDGKAGSEDRVWLRREQDHWRVRSW